MSIRCRLGLGFCGLNGSPCDPDKRKCQIPDKTKCALYHEEKLGAGIVSATIIAEKPSAPYKILGNALGVQFGRPFAVYDPSEKDVTKRIIGTYVVTNKGFKALIADKKADTFSRDAVLIYGKADMDVVNRLLANQYFPLPMPYLPKNGEHYFTYDVDGEIGELTWLNDFSDKINLAGDIVYPTVEMALANKAEWLKSVERKLKEAAEVKAAHAKWVAERRHHD